METWEKKREWPRSQEKGTQVQVEMERPIADGPKKLTKLLLLTKVDYYMRLPAYFEPPDFTSTAPILEQVSSFAHLQKNITPPQPFHKYTNSAAADSIAVLEIQPQEGLTQFYKGR